MSLFDDNNILQVINHSDRKTRIQETIIGLTTGIVAIWVLWPFITTRILQTETQEALLLLPAVVLGFLSISFIHEIIHFLLIWQQTKTRPSINWSSPIHMFVKLAPDTSISKYAALLDLMMPFLIITIGGVITSLFLVPIGVVMITILLVIHTSSCANDFLVSFKLLRCDGENIRYAHRETASGFQVVFFTES